MENNIINLILAGCATGIIWAIIHCVMQAKSLRKPEPKPRLCETVDYFLTEDTPKPSAI